MDETANFQETSYLLHETHHTLKNGELSDDQKSWLREDTVDFWRHDRMYKPLTPLLKNNPKTKWITVGDGRLGLDSIRLKKIEPSLDILPVDISTDLLEHAKRNGLINNYSRENAEKLSFPDNTFDFALCKESYHHFPRPFIALYEMLRVASNAVILIEPNDHYYSSFIRKAYLNFRNSVKRLLKKQVYHIDYWYYEDSGNYIYTLSKREVEKIALGLNFPAIAYLYFNDYYETGVEFEKQGRNSTLFRKVKGKIATTNWKTKIGLNNSSHLIAIIFKTMPGEKLIQSLEENGFTVSQLPRNPYIAK